MATELLKVPRKVDGDVVECGSFKGGSAANLSLVCELIGRTLHVYDSFEGLPEPSPSDREHVIPEDASIHTYEAGAFAGTLDEVKENISHWGSIKVCRFHPGFFDKTLPDHSDPCILVFVDVDFRESLEPCLRYLWPKLQDGCRFFTHEAGHMEIASIFFDTEWWANSIKGYPPGLVGAGSGIGLHLGRGKFTSDLGYAIKNPDVGAFVKKPQTGVSI
jgi:hypothetical protein